MILPPICMTWADILSSVRSIIALSKCLQLRQLDFSLSSSQLDLMSLMQAISQLKKLQRLHCQMVFQPTNPVGDVYPWPASLRELHIGHHFPVIALFASDQEAYNVDGSTMSLSSPQPTPRITKLTIHQHSVNAQGPFTTLIRHLGHSLRDLELILCLTGIPQLAQILRDCPELRRLRLPATTIDWNFFANLPSPVPLSANATVAPLLEELVLVRTADMPRLPRADIEAADPPTGPRTSLADAVSNGSLPNLRRLYLSHLVTEVDTAGPLNQTALLDWMRLRESQDGKVAGSAYVSREVGIWIT